MASLNLNTCTLAGHLVAKPELKSTSSGTNVGSAKLAITRSTKDANGQQISDFFNVTAFGKTAETLCKFFGKGSSILVMGSIQNRTWTGQDGKKQYATDIIADRVFFVDSKSDAPVPMTEATGNDDLPF